LFDRFKGRQAGPSCGRITIRLACRPFVLVHKGTKVNSSNGNKTKKPFPEILITRNEKDTGSGSFVQIPRFWVDEYFDSSVTWTLPDGTEKKGTRVPHSFWKYTLHLWRWVTIPQLNFSTNIAMDQFPVRPDAAVMWTAAYAVSGVMKVAIGKYSSRHDNPTVFTYDPGTTHAAWRCFLTALDYAYACREQDRRDACRDLGGQRVGTNVLTWKFIVAREVDNYRERTGLKRINEKFLDDAAEGRILTKDGERIAERNKDGSISTWHYKTLRRQRQEETDEDYSRRLEYEYDERKERQRNGGF
jgi:hypothetical protein